MSHTVHPYSFRLGIVRNWKSRWFGGKKYRKLLKGDILVREWLEKRLHGMYVDVVEIERTADVFNLTIKTSRPGLIIGRKGEGVELLKSELKKVFHRMKLEMPRDFRVAIEEVRKPDMHAAIVAQGIAESLEKRLPFRRVMKQAIQKVMANKEAKGIKVMLSGRLGGAEMSRTEWLIDGKMPLQTLRSDIDFSRVRAHLPYGDIGIKVWICREVEKE
jgi:small subunit ribosomal protein S3